jgi:homeobox-leucine zipper protein
VVWQWDVLVNGGSVKEEVRVANGVGSDDAVSILHVKVPEHQHSTHFSFMNEYCDCTCNFHKSISLECLQIDQHGHGANRDTMMILQNSSYDASGSFMVYSSLDKQLVETITNPGDSQAMSSINLFPAGFSLVPLTNPDPAPQEGSGSIAQPGATVMTAGFQILMKMARGTGLCPRSVSSAVKIMSDNITNIKDALLKSHPVFYKSIQSVD